MIKFYKLEGKNVVPLAEGERPVSPLFHIVAKTQLRGLEVSTIFIPIDHGAGGDPLVFETMVFRIQEGEINSSSLCRYSTYEQAEHGHIEMVKRAMAGEFNEKS